MAVLVERRKTQRKPVAEQRLGGYFFAQFWSGYGW